MNGIAWRHWARQLMAGAWSDFRGRCGGLVVYEIYFRLLSAAVIGPLATLLIGGMIAMTGQMALDNEQLVAFLLSPLGVVGGLLIGGAWLAIVFAEHVGLIAIGLSADWPQPMSATQALVRMVRLAPRLIQLGLWQLAGYAVLSLPFVAVAGGVYWTLLTSNDIYYLVNERPPEFLLAVAIGVLLAAGLAAAFAALYVRWLFALPILLVEGIAPRCCLSASRELVRGRGWRSGGLLALWWLLMMGVTAGVGGLLSRLDNTLFDLGGRGDVGLVIATVLALAIDSLVAAVISFVALTMHCLLIARMYREAHGSAFDRLWAPPRTNAATRLEALSGPRQRAILWSLVGLELLAAAVATLVLLENLPMNDRVEITAHRGSSFRAPENSLAAIRLAIAEGADYVEIDVQETADGQIVLLHDRDLLRTAGVNRGIWEIRADELADLDIGSWFDPRFRDERIPTLRQVIAEVRGKTRLNIELKFNGHDQRLSERVLEIVADEQFGEQCIITSISFEAIDEIRRRQPQLRVGYIVLRSIGDVTRRDVDLLSVSVGQVTDRLLHQAKAGNKEIHVWTVSDPAVASVLVDRGIDNLITNDPARMIAMLRERQELTNTQRMLRTVRNLLDR
jgi:glycerophosphoryl diester phosphodiesterase